MVDKSDVKQLVRRFIGDRGSDRRRLFWALTELVETGARLTAMALAAFGAVEVVEAGSYLIDLAARDGFAVSQELLTEIVLIWTAFWMMLGSLWFFLILVNRFPVRKRRYRRVEGGSSSE
ncbi:hypothetical protein C437_04785 [Haloarcula vallismortis ATCC 29715]|uniref:Uncharacterized protein n=1 Tax=Haloarcula vallismortis ATCC 29715 TaxID=662477 RepID=M0JPP4_HALVA|nr:hypothetical protein [Haloarcula vallismortis]EMA09944.1 hypothetical protein C437_04785 [Haloarcula vallismortis ATCC 29715]